jgi:Protein of unknown function (DUF3800)
MRTRRKEHLTGGTVGAVCGVCRRRIGYCGQTIIGGELRLAYLDESSDDAYFVNALLIQEKDLIPLSNALQDFRYSVVNTYNLDSDIEFHGYDLFNSYGDWAPLKSDYETIKKIFLEFLEVLLAFDVDLYIKGVAKDNFNRRYPDHTRQDIHNAAMLWCLEKVQKTLSVSDELALVIADQEHEGESFYRKNVRFFQTNPTFGWQPQILNRIVDTIHFAPSNESIMIQAIDMVSYANIQIRKKVADPRLQVFHQVLNAKIHHSGRMSYYGVW